jgi:2-haloacid dehalogenase
MGTIAPLEGVRACVFDAYGTLFDFASAAARSGALERGGERLAALWREKQLQYTWLRSIQGHHADFWQVTGEALDFALESLGISDPPLRERLMDLYLSLDTFPEVPQMLTRLKEAGVKTAVLSNGSPRMLEALVEHAGLRDHLDQVISVEEVGVFKPDPRVYQLAIDRLQIPPHEISFQSSNAWDAWAASAFGMQVVWCNRYGQKPERLPGAPDREIGSLAELPRIIGLRGAETGQCSI